MEIGRKTERHRTEGQADRPSWVVCSSLRHVQGYQIADRVYFVATRLLTGHRPRRPQRELEPIEEDVVPSRFGIEPDRRVFPVCSAMQLTYHGSILAQPLKTPTCTYEDRTCLSSALKEMGQHSDALDDCYNHLEESRNSLKAMEGTMNEHEGFFASKRSNLNAQVMNLRAQNEKLVYEVRGDEE
eukprot:768038-Hanusia_phi.AAC.1